MQTAQERMAANGPRARDATLDAVILAAAVRHLGERGYADMSVEAAGPTARTEPLPGAAGEPRAHAGAILENLRPRHGRL